LVLKQVHSAVVALDIEGLEDLVDERRKVLMQLERAMARRMVTGEEPKLWLWRDKSWTSVLLCRGHRVNAVEHLEKKLDKLNTRVSEMQSSIRNAAERLNEEQRKVHQWWRKTHRKVTQFLVGDPETRAKFLESEYIKQQREIRKQLEEEAAEADNGDCYYDEDGEMERFLTPSTTPKYSRSPALTPKGVTPATTPKSSVTPPKHHDRSRARTSSSGIVEALTDLTMDAIKVGARTGQAALEGAQEVRRDTGNKLYFDCFFF